MNRKFFPYDKNYLLEKAQLELEQVLIPRLIDFVKNYYLDKFNPLGLKDETILAIENHQTEYVARLEEFYRCIAAVYRYKYGENQLEILFDGRDHLCKYKEDWEQTFIHWLTEFCDTPQFIRAVLELTVFYPKDRKANLAANRMCNYLHQHFSLKIYKYRGIVEMRVA
jgi:hypothetical protein